MLRLSRPFASAVLLLFFVAGVRAADEKPLEAISSDAGVVIRLKAWSATSEKLKAFAAAAGPLASEMIKSKAAGIGSLISNEKLAGVDQSADWWVAIYPRPLDEQSQTVFIVPATDLKQLKAAVGERMKFREFGKYAIYTTDGDAADLTAARIKGDGKSIAGLIDKESTALFDRGDVSAFVNVNRFAAVYREDLEQLKEALPQLLDLFSQGLPGAPGLDIERTGGALRDTVQAITQGINDTQSITIAATIDPDGIYCEDLLQFAANSKTDVFSQQFTPKKMNLLQLMPVGAIGYLAAPGSVDMLAQLARQMLGGEAAADEKTQQMLAKTVEEMKKLRIGTLAASLSLGNLETGVTRTVVATEVDKPEKLRELTNATLKGTGAVQVAPGIKQTVEVKPDAEKFEELSVDHFKVSVEATDDADPDVAQALAIGSQLLGSEGQLTRVAYLQDKVVQTSGGGRKTMEEALAALDKLDLAAGRQESFQQVCEKLGEQNNLIALADLPGAVAKVIDMVLESGIFPIPIDDQAIKDLKLRPSYVGVSLATERQGVRVRTYLPTQQVAGIAGLVKIYLDLSQLFNAFQGNQ